MKCPNGWPYTPLPPPIICEADLSFPGIEHLVQCVCGCKFPAACPALIHENVISVAISIQNHKLIKMSFHCRTFKSEPGAVILRADSFSSFFHNTLLNEPESELTLIHFRVSLQLEKVVGALEHFVLV